MVKPKICFVSIASYPLIAGKNTGIFGGAELQQVLLARELIKNDFDVSFVVLDHGQKPFEVIDGIKIFKTFRDDRAGILNYYPKLRSIWVALKQANGDIYYQRSAGYITGIVALFCLLKKKRFVYSISSQSDVDGTHIKDSYLKSVSPLADSLHKHLYKFGIKNAHCIIAQNKYQQELLKKNFNKNSIVIKSGHTLPKRQKKDVPPFVLWVSRMANLKQPELFLKLAKAIPTAKFQMIGGHSGDKQFYEQIKNSANKIPNLDFLGFVPYKEVDQYFDLASIFVNTSTLEGFPNTFIQVWARYIPVVSLNVDPDGIICKYKLGFHSKMFEQMVEHVKLLLEDEKLREERGMNGRKYVEKEHDIKGIVKDYIMLFDKLVQK